MRSYPGSIQKKIVLFGSYAYGDPDDASDFDLLVIVDNLRSSRREARLKIRKSIRRYLIPKDIIVVTEKDVKDWQNVPSAFITSVMKNGRVIYERENWGAVNNVRT